MERLSFRSRGSAILSGMQDKSGLKGWEHYAPKDRPCLSVFDFSSDSR